MCGLCHQCLQIGRTQLKCVSVWPSDFFFFFFFIFSHFSVGSMCLVRRLHLGRSCASSPDNSLSDKSFLMISNHLRFGLPLLLFTPARPSPSLSCHQIAVVKCQRTIRNPTEVCVHAQGPINEDVDMSGVSTALMTTLGIFVTNFDNSNVTAP